MTANRQRLHTAPFPIPSSPSNNSQSCLGEKKENRATTITCHRVREKNCEMPETNRIKHV